MWIGVDIGGSLTKIVRESDDELTFTTLSGTEWNAVVKYLQEYPGAQIAATGCGGMTLRDLLPQSIVIIDELTSFCEGAKYFLARKDAKAEHIVCSFGTGTSIFCITEERSHRVTGTAVGGGTLMGLANLLLGVSDFDKLMQLACEGNRAKVDLMVSDLYPQAAASPLASSLTAANFGRRDLALARREDIASAIVQMVTETISLLSIQAARSEGVEKVVIAGSPARHPVIRQRFQTIGALLGQAFEFIEEGPYCGAMGAIRLAAKLVSNG